MLILLVYRARLISGPGGQNVNRAAYNLPAADCCWRGESVSSRITLVNVAYSTPNNNLVQTHSSLLAMFSFSYIILFYILAIFDILTLEHK